MSRVDEILALEPNEAGIELSNHVFFQRMERVGFDALTPAERVFRVVDEIEREVNNGGFDQYFINSSGDHAGQAVAALEAIGAHRTADIFRKALAVFGAIPPSPDGDTRFTQVAALRDEAAPVWHALEGEFYDYPDDLLTLQLGFVRAHRAEFLG